MRLRLGGSAGGREVRKRLRTERGLQGWNASLFGNGVHREKNAENAERIGARGTVARKELPMAQTSRTATRGETGAITLGQRVPAERATLTFTDFTDSLLQAYDGVARRAYQKFVARGSRPGSELDDWLTAEQELGGAMQVSVEESETQVYAMVTLSAGQTAEVSVAVEGKWMMVLDSQEFANQGAPMLQLNAMDWNSEKGRAEVATEWPGRLAAFGVWRDLLASEEADEHEEMRVRWGSQPFCMVELPAEVDAAKSTCVLADGVLAVKMMKAAVCVC
jgi:Protein of unknown function (DUF2934)